MAECHPVGFQWVMEARERGATIIHVDPRFTRTSAVADEHVPIRVGTDIAFLGGLINHVLQGGHELREYVCAYTNASTLVDAAFEDSVDGLFSGFDAASGTYDPASWGYEGMEPGSAAGEREQAAKAAQSEGEESHGAHGAALKGGEPPKTDPTLEHPRCVFQILKRHFARYTPELVQRVCGIPTEQFARVADAIVRNSGRERTTAFAYSVGWTHHTVGVQYIRTASILQLLLGNMGRPGGGILALRGHASIQGSTDIPTLYNILPGYLPMPHAKQDTSLAAYIETNTPAGGFWGHTDAYTVSLLKAWWGAKATPANDFCFDLLPKLTGDHSIYPAIMGMRDGDVEGFFVMGENPTVGSANAKLHRLGMANLKWLVVRDLQPIESATFWRDGPEIETGELKTEEIGTEVFFLPAAAHTEKSGSFTNTQRLLQWHHQAVEPPDDARSELHFMFHLVKRIRAKLAGSTEPRDRAVLDLTWDYPTAGAHDDPDAHAILKEISGYTVADGEAVSGYTALKADGSTASGCWIYSGTFADDVNQAARRRPGSRADVGRAGVGLGVADEPADPLQPRVGRPRGPPVERAQALRLVGRRAGRMDRRGRARLQGRPGAGLRPARGGAGRTRAARRRAVRHAGRRQGLALRPDGPRRRAAARALRAPRVPGAQRAAPGRAGEPDPPDLRPRRQPLEPVGGRPGRRRLPLRAADLPDRRAPHGGRGCRAGCPTSPSSRPTRSSRSRPSSPRERGPGAQRVGDDRLRCARRSRRA